MRPVSQFLQRCPDHPFAQLDDRAGGLGHRDKFVRQDDAPGRMIPADQRFIADGLLVLDIDQRLVEQFKLLALERGLQVQLHRPAVLQRLQHLGPEHRQLPAPVFLGPVQRDIGALQQILCGIARIAGQRDADADADRNIVPVDTQWRTDLASDVPAEISDILSRRDRPQADRELVAAQPRGNILDPDRFFQPAADRLQHPVPGAVPHRVVDRLEPVDVHIEQGQAFPVVQPGQRALHRAVERRAVGQTGQIVIMGQPVDLVVGRLFAGDIGRRSAQRLRCPARGSHRPAGNPPPMVFAPHLDRQLQIAHRPALADHPQQQLAGLALAEQIGDRGAVEIVDRPARSGREPLRRADDAVAAVGFPQPVGALLGIVVEQQLDRFGRLLLLRGIDMALDEIEEAHAVDRVERSGEEEQQRHRLQPANPPDREKADRQRQRQHADRAGLRARDAAIGETADDDAAERQDHAGRAERNLPERQRKGDAQADREADDDTFHAQHAQRGVEMGVIKGPVLLPVEIAHRDKGDHGQPEQPGGEKWRARMEIEIDDHIERHRDHDRRDNPGHFADQPQLLPRNQLADLRIAVGVEPPEFLVNFDHPGEHQLRGLEFTSSSPDYGTKCSPPSTRFRPRERREHCL